MTLQVNIAEAKAKLSELVARAEAGEEIVVARHGKAVVRLWPVGRDLTGERQLGVWDHLKLDLGKDLFIGGDPETVIDAPIFPPE